MARTVKVTVQQEYEVDAEAWAREFYIEIADAAPDLRSYLGTEGFSVFDSYYFDHGIVQAVSSKVEVL